MCCRYVLLKEHLAEIVHKLGLEPPAEFASRFNLAPGQLIPAVRAAPAGTGLEIARLNWGLIPAWASPGSERRPNARAETLASKPSFRDAFRTRRCLLPASGFYEWEKIGKARLPWLFRSPGSQPFCLAGIWESRSLPDGTHLETCAVITSEPNAVMRPIHHRMPVILLRDQFDRWLDPRATRPEDMEPLLGPAPNGSLAAMRVGTRVNSTAFDNESCLLPPEPGTEGAAQFDLGLG